MSWQFYFGITILVLFRNLGLQHSDILQSTTYDMLIHLLLFVLKFLKRLFLFGSKYLQGHLRRLYPYKYLDHVLFFFLDLTYTQKTQKKALGVVIPVDKNKHI